MAEKVIVDVEVNTIHATEQIVKAREQLKGLKADEAELNKQREEGAISNDKYIESLAEINANIEANNQVIRANRKEIQQNVKMRNDGIGSLNVLRKNLKQLQNEYDALGKVEREGARGMELQKKIELLSTDVKGLEQATGRTGRNVGNYLAAIMSGFANAGGAAGQFAGGLGTVKNGLTAISRVPIIAILGALVNIIGAVVKALKSSETNFNKVRLAMSGLQGVGDLVTKTLQSLGKGIAWVAEKLGGLLAKIGVVNDAMNERQKITEAQIALEKRRVAVTKENADLELEASVLLNKIEQKNQYTAKERLAFADEANAKLLKISKNNEDLARRNYQIIHDTNELTESSTEDLQNEANAYAEMKQAEKEYFDRSKELATKKIELQNQILANAAKEVQQTVEAGEKTEVILSKLKPLTSEIGDALLNIGAEGGDAMAGYVEEVRGELDAAAGYWDNYLNVVEDEARMEEEIQQNKMLAIASVFGNLSAITAKFGEKNEKLAKASKILAVAQVTIEGGIAIAKATKSGADLGIPGIIATVATATTNLALALASINAAKFSTGGFVTGPGTATSDSIPARLSNGESVINARSTKMFRPLLSAINVAGGGRSFDSVATGGRFATGGFVGINALKSVRETAGVSELIEAIKEVQPVVSVREITTVQNRIKAKEDFNL